METQNLSIKDLNALIGSDAYWQVNKKIARYFKCNNTALLLSDFISKQHYFGNIGKLNNGYFFNTSTNIEEDCNISYSQQKKCIESLKKVGFLETWLTGAPAKLHFKINANKIWAFLNSSIQESRKLDL